MSTDLKQRETGAQPVAYASFHRRFNALLIDIAVVIAGVMFLVTAMTVAESDMVTRVSMGLVFACVLLYDPLLVAARAGTIGHYRQGMRVVHADTGGRVGLARALFRASIKAPLGLFSFVFMLVTRRHQALHDLASRSIVIIHDLDAVDPDEVLYERDESGLLVPRWRRVAAIVGYSVAFFLLYSVLGVLLVTADCTLNDVCTPADDLVDGVLALAMFVTFGVVLVLGWRARLPGARGGRPALDPVVAEHDQA